MKKNFKFIVAAIAAVAMIGCAKDKGGSIDTPAAGTKKTTATVTITQNVGRALPAAGWNTASTDESKLHDVSVYVFNANKQLEQIVEFTQPVTDGASETFETTNGLHTIIVLANEPADVATAVSSMVSVKDIEGGATGPATMYSQFLAATTLAFADQAAFVSTVKMANDKLFISNFQTGTSLLEHDFVVPTDVLPNPPANNITLSLGRAFAKTTADWVNTVSPATAGTVQSLEYVVLHNPVKMYAPQNIVNGVYKTIFHDVTNSWPSANYYDWKNNEANPANNEWKPATGAAQASYIPENTNKNVVYEGERTAMGFRAKFVPSTYYKINLVAATKAYDNATWTDGNDFYRVKDLRSATIASATGVITGGSWIPDIYFEGIPSMEAIRKTMGIDISVIGDPKPYGKYYNGRFMADDTDPDWNQATAKYEGDYTIGHYTNSLCYYYLGLENSAINKPNPVRYNVGRNDYFWVSVDSIQDCGEPTLTGATPDPWTPVDVTLNLKVTIKVENWTPIIQNGHL